jgi:type VI secretion system secreted protein Hcp
MSIYLKYGDHNGSVTTKGFEGYSECMSFSWGLARNISTAAHGASNREHGQVAVQDIHITKTMDAASTKLLGEAWGGNLKTKVLIKFTTMAEKGVTEFLTYELENTGVSSYQVSGSGGTGEGMPTESMSFNFTKITETFKVVDEGHVGAPSTVHYDLQKRVAG